MVDVAVGAQLVVDALLAGREEQIQNRVIRLEDIIASASAGKTRTCQVDVEADSIHCRVLDSM